MGPNSGDNGPHDVSLYDVSNPRATDVVVTTFPTPGHTRAVSIFNGRAYVADDTAGLQVVNYLPYDAKGVPTTIVLATSFPTNGVEESKLARVDGAVGDDVQVRNVEFYLDGEKVFTAAAFLFEFRFVTPRLATGKTLFAGALARSTRAATLPGRRKWVTLQADTRPPRVTQCSSLSGAKVLRFISVYFDGPMDSVTLNAGTFKLFSAGADGVFGTADDLPSAAAAFLTGLNSRQLLSVSRGRCCLLDQNHGRPLG